MSRPFSYNDENFTVIGNILFVHAAVSGNAYQIAQKIITIPQAIFTRMTSYNQQGVISNFFVSGAAGVVGVTCTENGDLVTRTSISKSTILPRYLFTWYVLKDI